MVQIIKSGTIKVPTQPKDFDLKATGLVFKSYDNQVALEFNVEKQDGTPADLLGANLRLLMFIYDEIDGTVTKEPIPFITKNLITESFLNGHVVYILPEAMKAYNGMVETYVYIEYSDGSTSDNLGFTFRMQRSKIDGLAQDKADYFITDFQQLLDAVKQKAADAVNETLAKVEASSTKMQELEQRIDEQTEIFNNADVYNKAEIEDKLEPFALRTDIDTLDAVKADKKSLALTDSKVADLDSVKADKTALSQTNILLTNGLNSKVDKGGNEQVTMAMLSQEVKEAMTGGSVAVVGPGGVNATNIVDGAVGLTKISSKTVDILASQSQNYNETAINLGYRRFITFPVEDGGIISTTGNNRDYPASIRSKSKINFEFNNLLFIVKDPNLRIRLFVYNQSGNFEGVGRWFTDKQTFTVDTSKLYRFEINTIDDTALNLEYGYSACKIVYQDEKISNFDTLEDKLTNINDTVSSRLKYEKTPINYGYNQFNIYEYEYGSINPSNGNDSNSKDSIRTLKNNLITFDSAITVINLVASKYRIKFVGYNADGSMASAGLWVNADKNTFSLDLSKQFRIQIATMDGSDIDLEKALQNIKIVYADDIVANIPRYWQKYLDARISKVKPELSNGTDLSAMLITTDTHFTFNNVNEINPAVAKYICDKMGIGTLLHLGDVIAENASKSIATERMNYVMSKYRNVADNFYPIRGNHDDNNEGGKYPYSSCITQKESYSWMFRRNSPHAVMGETGTYYYVDNEFEKTRMIFLDVIDFPYADNGSNKIKEKHLSWGIKQLDWFANKALKVPEGYSIAIFNHTPIVESIVTKEHGISASKQTLPKNAQQMIEILEAYVARSKKDITINLTDVTSYEYFNGVVSVDFTQSAGRIVGWFCGHEHIDDIQEIGSTGIKNVIILNNSSNFSADLISSTYQPERKMFDVTEEVYDLLIIDKSSQKVTLERFGAGNSVTRSFSY
ncbi:TPA: BppU family phage baseplate upper protein [Enterococcus faecium]|nr:BppU family phage baseplate upper protein [Enterococcus faecium]